MSYSLKAINNRMLLSVYFLITGRSILSLKETGEDSTSSHENFPFVMKSSLLVMTRCTENGFMLFVDFLQIQVKYYHFNQSALFKTYDVGFLTN